MVGNDVIPVTVRPLQGSGYIFDPRLIESEPLGNGSNDINVKLATAIVDHQLGELCAQRSRRIGDGQDIGKARIYGKTIGREVLSSIERHGMMAHGYIGNRNGANL